MENNDKKINLNFSNDLTTQKCKDLIMQSTEEFSNILNNLEMSRNNEVIKTIKNVMKIKDLTFKELIKHYTIELKLIPSQPITITPDDKLTTGKYDVIFTKKKLFQKIFKTKQEKDLLYFLTNKI